MPTSSLVKKLLIKPRQRAAVINAPAGYLDALGPLPEGVEMKEQPNGPCDFVQLFAKDTAELNRFAPVALAALKRDGLFWIAYPKQSANVKTDLTRDRGWDPIHAAGLIGVAMVAIDDVWSAMRFRPTELTTRGKSA